jgi:hypothetical protein
LFPWCKNLLEAVDARLGMVPNMMRAMANALAVYFNHVAGTAIDFPRASALTPGAAKA